MFIKVEMDYFKNSNLKGANEILTYSLLCDRMKASKNNKDFFDKKFGDSYIIFKREELAEYLDVTVKTVTKILKSLVKKGYLILKHQFNASSKLFLPKFENEKSTSMPVKEEITSSFGKNLPSNKSTLTDKYITDNTKDTYPETNSPKIVAITQKEKQAAKQEKLNELEINALSSSLETKAGLSKRTVNMLKALSFNDPKKLYELSGMVFKAKNVVKRQARNVMNSQFALSFENNNRYEDMAVDLQRIVMTANRSKRSNVGGYIFSSLVNYFQEAVNDYCIHDVQSVIG